MSFIIFFFCQTKTSPNSRMSSTHSQTHSCLGEPPSSLRREKDDLLSKLNNSYKENAILSKQLEHMKREQGELLIARHESKLQITQLHHQCHLLTERLASQNLGEIQRLRAEKEEIELKLGNLSKEVEILKKQLGHERRENEELTKTKTEMKNSLKEAEEKRVKMAEKLKRAKKEEAEVILKEKNQIKTELETVMAAASQRYNDLVKRVTDLEDLVAVLCNSSGAQQTEVTNEIEQLESFEAGEKTPSGNQTAAAPPHILLSDDDEEIPSSKGLKWIISPEHSDNSKDGAYCKNLGSKQPRNSSCESLSYSAPLSSSLKCYGKNSEIEINRRHESAAVTNIQEKIEWECQADMLDSLGKDTDLCVKAVCALYRQHATLCRSSSPGSFFRHLKIFQSFRGAGLAEFLLCGDPNGPLKRSLADLQKFDPNGANECRNIAFSHSQELFEIYKSLGDPFFGFSS